MTTFVGCHSIRPSTSRSNPVGPSSRIVKAATPDHLYFSQVLNLTALLTQSSQKGNPMRLTLRFLALILLIVIATFPNSSSITTLASDNPCFEGCARGYQNCTGGCGLNAGCLQKCESDRMTCEAKCKAGDFALPSEPPAN